MENLVKKIEKFIGQYVTLADPIYSLPIALWTIGTYLWPDMDAFPYLVITASTKRAGKTRLAECMSFITSNSRMSGAMGTASASMFKLIDAEKPTLYFDEAESMSGEAANNVRSILNMGYRKGQKVVRVTGESQVHEYEVYCPKVFILIGDMFDTVRDRSIVIQMKRGEPSRRFVFSNAEIEGEEIRGMVQMEAERRKMEFVQAFNQHQGLTFLTDRDEEIWLPLFSICQIVCPERIAELSKNAVDIATEKTQEKKRYVNTMGDESKAQDDEYAKRLLADVQTVIGSEKCISNVAMLDALKALPTSPWRKYLGEGLTLRGMADMLSRFGVRTSTIRVGKGKSGSNANVLRGYKREDIHHAAKQH